MGVIRSGLLLGVAIGVATWAYSTARRVEDRRRVPEDEHDRWEGEGGNVPASQVGAGLQGRPAVTAGALADPAVLGGTAETASQRVPFPGGAA